MSLLLKSLAIDFPDSEKELELDIEGKTLEKIIEYLKHYKTGKPKDIPKPLPSSNLSPPLLDQWDYDYILKLSFQECVDLINGAYYLCVPELENLVAARFASEMFNDEVEEIKIKLRGINPCSIAKIISFK